MKKRKHFLFTGGVQGVGFRITVYQKAMKYHLSGWVKNLSNGDVEACLQGEEVNIEKLIDELTHIRYIFIDKILVEDLSVLQQENSFEIKY